MKALLLHAYGHALESSSKTSQVTRTIFNVLIVNDIDDDAFLLHLANGHTRSPYNKTLILGSINKVLEGNCSDLLIVVTHQGPIVGPTRESVRNRCDLAQAQNKQFQLLSNFYC